MKRKNSKEKEKELLERQQQQQQQNNGADANTVATATSGGSSNTLKRSNPGDDIQPATIQPMFTRTTSAAVATPINRMSSDSSNNEAFNAMAANISRNISTAATPTNNNRNNITNNPTSHQNIAAASNNNNNNLNKRTKLNQPATASSSTGRGYTVAIGKGVRHQLNGYLRSNSSTTNSSTNTAAPSFPAIPSTTKKNTAYNTSYLSHPSAKLASSAPAPLQFLDPSELGMSIESSLSQLKNAFAAASGGTTVAAAGTGTGGNTVASTAPAYSRQASASSTTSSSNNSSKYAASGMSRRVSFNAFLGGMLSRDDSLINLAMLPTLDNAPTSTISNGTSTNAGATATSGTANDYMTEIFSRDDPLVNLAASVEMTSTSSSSAPGFAANVDNAKQENEAPVDGNDTFDFIDFQS